MVPSGRGVDRPVACSVRQGGGILRIWRVDIPERQAQHGPTEPLRTLGAIVNTPHLTDRDSSPNSLMLKLILRNNSRI